MPQRDTSRDADTFGAEGAGGTGDVTAEPVVPGLARRYQLADKVRLLRTAAGMNRTALAGAAGVSVPVVTALETPGPDGGYRLADAHAVLGCLGLDDQHRAKLEALAADATAPGWWHAHPGGRADSLLAASLEAGAAAISYYRSTELPDLALTDEFARRQAATRTGRPVEPAEVDRQAALIAARQQHSSASPVLLILDEGGLRRWASAPDVATRAQVAHLAGLAGADPRWEVRLLPVDAVLPDYRVPHEPVDLYRYPADPPLGCVLHDAGATVLHDRVHLVELGAWFAALTAAALSTEATAARLRALTTP